MLTRRKFLGVAGPVVAATAVCYQMQVQPKQRPEKIEPEQVYLTKDGRKRIIGDQWHNGQWAWCGPILLGDVIRKKDWWVTDVAWLSEIETWTYLGSLTDLEGGGR